MVETDDKISLNEFRMLKVNEDNRHPGRSLDQCIFDKDFSENNPITVLNFMEHEDIIELEPVED